MPVNGVPQDTIAIQDRGLAYGDGLFETILIHQHQPVLLEAHLYRLKTGAERLRINLDSAALDAEISALSPTFPASGVLKIIITRGTGGRGYLPADQMSATRITSLHPLPDYAAQQPERGMTAFVCQQRLAHQPALAGIKHLNRLEQVLASLEWPGDEYLEGVMLDTLDHVVEGTRSNIFWVENGQLHTPALHQCGVAGIMRNYLVDAMGNVLETPDCTLARLGVAEEVFFCNSVFGVWPLLALQNGMTRISFDPERRHFTRQAARAVADLLDATVA
jgi:4-amino-4-deoxychorismate lyase